MSDEIYARDMRLKAIERSTVIVAAVAVAATCGMYVGMQFPANSVVADPPVVNVAAPVVHVTVATPVSKAAAPSATVVPQKVVAAPKAVTTTKKVATSGGS